MEEILSDKEIKILKWKIRIGSQISIGNILLLYKDEAGSGGGGAGTGEGDKKIEAPKRLKSNKCGVVKKLFYKDGDVVPKGWVWVLVAMLRGIFFVYKIFTF